MAKFIAFFIVALALIAVASAQYLATYPRAAVLGSPYAYARTPYAAPAFGYAGAYSPYAGRLVYG